MKYFKIVAALITLLAFAFSSCTKKYEELETNPNRPEAVTPELVFKGVLADLNTDRPWSMVMRWNQFDVNNYNYYGDQRYDWTGAELNYITLKNVVKMEEEALRLGGGPVNPYAALGKFFRAFLFYRMTNLVGDIPMSEALQGKEQLNPVYNTQKDVYLQILKWLEESNAELDQLVKSPDKANTTEGQLLKGDIYFNNDLLKWQRSVNAFRLRVLISLSKKETDPDLKLKQAFTETISNKSRFPLLENSGDNLQYIYNNINKYPSNPDNLGFDATRYNMSATYLNRLVVLNDPRAYIVAEPATKKINREGKTPADITAYNGASSGENQTEMSSKMANVEEAEYSVRSRARYYSSYAAEPGVIVGYPEMCFNIAEAINRGWITGDAEEWYKKGIKSSMAFYGIPVEGTGTIVKIYKNQTYPINIDFENGYYKQSTVTYQGNTEVGLSQIIVQKYLAFFENSGWEAYFNWRRTGVPEFLTGTGTGNSGVIPRRFQYPVSERTTNADNWKDAVQRQFAGNDNINAIMWLIK